MICTLRSTGSVWSTGRFETVTVTVDVAALPAASVATADIVCDPFDTLVESHVMEYGDDVPDAPVLVASI